MTRTLKVIAILAPLAALVFMLAGCERSLIYYPARGAEEALVRAADSEGLKPWRDAEGALIGWVAKADAQGRERAAAIVFHGNAGHAAARAYYARGLRAATEGSEAWDVYLLEYPGYGSRSGKPSERALKVAALEAVDQLIRRGYESLYAVGESLGSGVACHVASERGQRVRGLLLVTPFTSLLDVAKHHYPALLARALLSERYDNKAALEDYNGPVAILLAGRDEVVPVALGQELFDAYQGPKRLWIQEGKGHNTLALASTEAWWGEAVEFLQQ